MRVADIIPPFLYQAYFHDHQLSSFEISILSMSSAALLKIKSETWNEHTEGQLKKIRRILLLILYSAHTFNAVSLKRLAHELRFGFYNLIGLVTAAGRIDLFNEFVTAQNQDIITEKHYALFDSAVIAGKLNIVKRILELAPYHQDYLLGKYTSFARKLHQPLALAEQYGHAEIYEYLADLLNLDKRLPKKLLQAELIQPAEIKQEEAISEYRSEIQYPELYRLMKIWVLQGAFNTIKKILQQIPATTLQKLLSEEQGRLLADSIRAENLALWLMLIDRARELTCDTPEMHKVSYIVAAKQGNAEVLSWVLGKSMPEIEDDEYQSIHQVAIRNMHTMLLRYYLDNSSVYISTCLLKSDNLKKITKAMPSSGAWLFFVAEPSFFAYIEMHAHEYPELVKQASHNTLQTFYRTQRVFTQAYPNGVFDIVDAKEVKNASLLLRHFIRSHDLQHVDDIRFLLDIPSVKNRIHLDSSNDQPNNELLQLAMSVRYQAVVMLLLNIPAVLRLAERNGYYHSSQREGLDLRYLAGSRESSMACLTVGEEQRLNKVIQHYELQVRHETISGLMGKLSEQIKHLYQQEPAVIEIKKQKITLPLEYKSFQALKLAGEQQTKASHAYYQNKAHTALRYLSKPNHWMSPAANNVYRLNGESWSSFQEYQALITMFYLAAIDPRCPPSKGVSIQDRFKHFVNELAYIGRAHNWDRSRPILDEKGVAVPEETEEYDDQEGDKPSCFGGVKRRLFQSVTDHELLQVLTRAGFESEWHEFVREHYAGWIRKGKKNEIQKNWDAFIESGDEKHIKKLVRFNLTQADFNHFEHYMKHKYAGQWDDEISKMAEEAYSLTVRQVIYQSHFEKYYCAARLDHLVQHNSFPVLSDIERLKQTAIGNLFHYQEDAQHRITFKGKIKRQAAIRNTKVQGVLSDLEAAGSDLQRIRQVLASAASDVKKEHRSHGIFKRFTRSSLEKALTNSIKPQNAGFDLKNTKR